MARHALVLRHVLFEDLGIFASVLDERGYAARYLDVGVDPIVHSEVEGADLVVVLGGPIGVGDRDVYPALDEEIRAVASRLEARGTTLGICLGAQIMASALGASVSAGPVKEIGFGAIEILSADNVLAPLRSTPVLHWHGDTFDLPAGATRLASSDAYENQAFSWGSSLALQFHLEADPARIEQWLIGNSLELAVGGIAPATIRADAAQHGEALAAAGRRILSGWLDDVEP